MVENTKELLCYHKEDGTYLYVSPAIETITGYKPDELIGKNPYDYFHPEDQEYIRVHSHLPSIKGQDDFVSEYRFRTRQGRYIWLQTLTKQIKQDGEVYLITSSRDISKERKIRLERQKFESLLNQASEMAKVGAWDFDLKNSKPHWSKVVYDIHEVPYDEQPDLENAIKFYDEGESRDTIVEKFNAAVNEGTPFDVTSKFTGALGTKKWVRSICRPEVSNGKVTRVYGVFQDVTAEKNKTEQVKQLAQILQKQKEQLESFNQIVSHNLRSPVANLPILLDMLEESETKSEKEEYLDDLRSVAKSMSELLDDLVDVAKVSNLEQLEVSEMHIEDMLDKILAQFQGGLKKSNAKIEVKSDAWQKIIYPRIYLESTFHNLLSNAIKYRSEKRPLRIHIKTVSINGMKGLEFSDNGSGIDMKRNAQKIFKLHKTFHRDRPGKGLGLFMTRHQIRALGGDIRVESEPEKGTTFSINFNRPLS